MNSRIFRKVSVERLSSPEQLDLVLRVTTPKSWAILVALMLIASVAIVWGYTGLVPTTAAGDGILARSGGVLNVVARGSGPVTHLYVKAGEKVRANQVVARIAQPGLEEKMTLARQQIEQIRTEGDRSLRLRAETARLRVDAILHQRENLHRAIKDLEEQTAFAAQQVPLQEQLYRKGLTTQQRVLQVKEHVIALQAQTDAQRAQIKSLDAQKSTEESTPALYDSDLKSRSSEAERALAGLRQQWQLASEVISPYAGEVLELKVLAGGSVDNGFPILSIQPDSTHLEALIFVSSTQAKDVAPGMAVQLSPSSVRREEFGYLSGRVQSVSDYPATHAALMRNFQNDTLVTALNAKGPVNEVRVVLDVDAATSTGYRWSSGGGPPIAVTAGTVCTALIVTREQRPVTLVFPILKEKLGLN